MSKFGAKRCKIDDISFDSQLEGARYRELKLLVKAGQISELQVHVPYSLEVSGKKVGKYVTDFEYWDRMSERRVIEDVKGVRTPVYRLKKKIFEAQYGIQIRELTKRDIRVKIWG